MRLMISSVAFLCMTALSFGFIHQGFPIAARLSPVAGRITMMSKRRSENRGERKYLPSKSYVINPEARKDPGVIIVNLKTNEITKAEYKPIVKAKPSEPEIGTLELYCKAGADGKSLGDCPFTHYVNMVLQFKKLPFELKPCAPDAKPEWLIEDFDGKMPCLVHNEEAYTESDEIVRYINYFFPKPSLTNEYIEDIIENADEVTSEIFPLLASCIKNLNSEDDEEMIEEIMEELNEVEELIKDSGGPFLCGTAMTTADCSFAPKLYHLKTTLAHFKNTVIPPEMEKLHAYMDTVFSHPAFIASSYPPDVIVWGWNNARGTSD